MRNQLEMLLSDMTYNSKFRFLDAGSDKKELAKIAEKRGIKIPSNDLACFKCVYAFVDRQNLNGCTLPREEVDKALETLVGKAIDFDHFRKRVVGFWIDAAIEGEKLVAWGIFFKNNFSEDFATIKELMEKDTLAISFEAWGDKVSKKGKDGYDLVDIEFAGGALLIKTQPAFPGSEVLEMAKERVLEMASVMTAPKEFIHSSDQKTVNTIPEKARYYIYDVESIVKALTEVDCAVCHQKGYFDVLGLDFEANTGNILCVDCGTRMAVSFTPRAELSFERKIKEIKALTDVAMFEDIVEYINSYKGEVRELELKISHELEKYGENKLSYEDRSKMDDDMFAVVITSTKEKSDEPKKIRIFPIHDVAHITDTVELLEEPKTLQVLQKLGLASESIRKKILNRARMITMKDLFEKYKTEDVNVIVQEIAKVEIKRELSKEELEKAFTLIELKATGKNPGDTSLNNMPKKVSDANPTSLQTASVSEDDIKAIVKEVANVVDEAKKAEEAKALAEAQKAEADAKAEEAKKASDKQDEVAKLKETLATLEAELATFRKAKEDAEKAAKDAKIKEIREGLGEFAKDLSDEDLFDEVKMKIAKLEKENAELKSGKITPADLTKGSSGKSLTEEEIARKNIDTLAFTNYGNSVEGDE